jgi:hypothetical protein
MRDTMDTPAILTLTPYGEINALLVALTRGLECILGLNLIGLYLSGSLAYGDFVPGRSDIDLQAVVRCPPGDEALTSIEQMHHDLNARHAAWTNRHECSYVPLEFLGGMLPPATPRPWWGFDTFYREAPAGNEWIINHYFLVRHGISLHGPAFETLIPTIDPRAVQRASARDLFQEWLPLTGDSGRLADPHMQSYVVLNLCRILHTVLGDGPGSKPAAARWACKAFPQWCELIAEAEQWEYGRAMRRQGDVISFIEFAAAKVGGSGVLD